MRKPIKGPASWRGDALTASRDWIHEFIEIEVGEIEEALRTAKACGKMLDTLTKGDFPLPNVARRIAFARDFLENGMGLYQLRGIRPDAYSKGDLRLLYWGIGRHLGTAVSQSKDGDILGDVRNVGVDIHSPQGREYKSSQRLNFHTDSADVVGLFVLCVAKNGGLSKVASSVAAHDEILRRRPDLLEVLYRPFYWSWNQQEPPEHRHPTNSRSSACRTASSPAATSVARSTTRSVSLRCRGSAPNRSRRLICSMPSPMTNPSTSPTRSSRAT